MLGEASICAPGTAACNVATSVSASIYPSFC